MVSHNQLQHTLVLPCRLLQIRLSLFSLEYVRLGQDRALLTYTSYTYCITNYIAINNNNWLALLQMENLSQLYILNSSPPLPNAQKVANKQCGFKHSLNRWTREIHRKFQHKRGWQTGNATYRAGRPIAGSVSVHVN